MASIPYLTKGHSLLAADWNTLFKEADRKLSLILAQHGILWWNSTQTNNGIIANFWFGKTGKCFFFGTNFVTDIIFGQYSDYYVYNHQAVLDYVAAILPPAQHDDTVKLLTPNAVQSQSPAYQNWLTHVGMVNQNLPATIGFQGAILDLSLAMHTVQYQPAGAPQPSTYKIQDFLAANPDHIRNYDVAELVCTADVTMPDIYNKYNFFRIHNFSQQPIKVTFNGFVANVPGFGSQCVRRTGIGGTYTAGWNHFFPMMKGDPRTFWPFNSGYAQTTTSNVAGNNCINPGLVAQIFAQLMNTRDNPSQTGGSLGGTMTLGGAAITDMDWSQAWDASSIYCGPGNPFGELDPDTFIGDLLVQKGQLLSIQMPSGFSNGRKAVTPNTPAYRYPIFFNGFGTIASDFAAGGITVTQNQDGTFKLVSVLAGTLTAAHDLLDVSSNFSLTFGGSIGGISTIPGPNGSGLNTLTPYGSSGAAQDFLAAGTLPTNFQLVPPRMGVIAQQETIAISGFGFSNVQYAIPVMNFGPGGEFPANFPPIATLDTAQTLQNMGATTWTPHYKFTAFGLLIWWDVSIAFTGLDGFSAQSNLWRISQAATHTFPPPAPTATMRPMIWMQSAFPNPTSGDVSGNFERKPAKIGLYRALKSVSALITGSAGFVGKFFPDWTYPQETPALTDAVAKTPTSVTALTDCNIVRPFSLQGLFHLTAFYAAKATVTLVKVFNFTKEQDGPPPVPLGFNTQWASFRGNLLANDLSWDFTANNAGVRQGPAVFERMLIMIEHYNAIASYVNCANRYIPLNQASVFGRLAAWSFNIAPGIGVLIDSEGIAPYTIWPRDMFIGYISPDIFFPGDVIYGMMARSDVPPFPTAVQGDAITVAPGFKWFDISTVRTFCASWGFQLAFAASMVPVDIVGQFFQSGVDTGSTAPPNYTGFGGVAQSVLTFTAQYDPAGVWAYAGLGNGVQQANYDYGTQWTLETTGTQPAYNGGILYRGSIGTSVMIGGVYFQLATTKQGFRYGVTSASINSHSIGAVQGLTLNDNVIVTPSATNPIDAVTVFFYPDNSAAF